MGRLTQRVINKQIGSGGFKSPQKCCGKNIIQQSIISGVPIEPEEPDDELPLRLTFDAIGNAPVVDPTSLADWNTFFDLPNNGTPFTSVEVVGNDVKLYGGSGITLAPALFNSNGSIVSLIDSALCIVAVGQIALADCAQLTTVTLNAALTFADGACSNDGAILVVTAILATDFGVGCFDQDNFLNTIAMPNAINIGAGCFTGCQQLETVSIPLCTNLGGTVGDDGVFNGSGMSNVVATLTVPIALQTCDGGNPDGDIQFISAATIIYV